MRVKVRASRLWVAQALVVTARHVGKAILPLGRAGRFGERKGARVEMWFAFLLGLIGIGAPTISAGWGVEKAIPIGATPGKSVALYSHVPLSFEL